MAKDQSLAKKERSTVKADHFLVPAYHLKEHFCLICLPQTLWPEVSLLALSSLDFPSSEPNSLMLAWANSTSLTKNNMCRKCLVNAWRLRDAQQVFNMNPHISVHTTRANETSDSEVSCALELPIEFVKKAYLYFVIQYVWSVTWEFICLTSISGDSAASGPIQEILF